ncbi:OLC1v1032620C1 [Oldenlandia corymbosa var. corymbosa]|uniref:OLC1v1032620C1 n=1 Tax=Oldenlandia corymbosa var. corymbosa TaxID=529605 RepID=A0AAV1CPA9_OLDCO|nr:OLC1v1032620C1 [Oldenlandia corymbosa var. corymbosa]
MYVVESKGGAIVCMLLALFFLGTWPAIITMLERRGRLPQHTYLDYTITNLLAAVIIAFTFGEIGKGTSAKPNFLEQLSQDNWPSVMFAMAGGIVLSLGNLATQYAWAYVGLSVTEVICSSVTVVIGTTLNYFLDDKINKAEILFPGVGCFLIAVCFGSVVHSSNAADNKSKLNGYSTNYGKEKELKSISVSKQASSDDALVDSKDLENGNGSLEKASFGTAHFLIELENKRSIKVFGKSTFLGLGITFFAGFCFSLFSPAFNLATNDQWHTLKEGVPHLSVYIAFFYFSVSCFVVAIILNISFLFCPVLNTSKSSFKAYLSDWNGRGWALLAGLLCGFGNGLQFMGGQAAGYAAADAVQALPLDFLGIFFDRSISRKKGFLPSWGLLKMYVVESKGGAIACMLLALLLLGTWPAIVTLLERRGRLPQHTYLDYTITNFLAAVIIAFTFGEIGKGTTGKPDFLEQISQDNWPSIMFAMAGGVFLSLGNLSTQYAWAYVSLSVAVVICCSMVVVIGTTLNYFLDDRINKAEILFPGVGCFLIAICLASVLHSLNEADNKAKLNSYSTTKRKNGEELKSISLSKQASSNDALVGNDDLENGNSNPEKAAFGTAQFLIQLEHKRSIKAFGKSAFLGLGITFFAGLSFSLFSPAFNLATNDQWHTLKEGVPHLSVYTAFFYFSLSCFALALILNITFLFRPILNTSKSSFKAYLSDWNGRGLALLAGLLCGFGNGLQFIGGQAAGYAAADAVQALPLVSTFWGIVLFGEYRRSSMRTYLALGAMLFMFIVAVAVLIASAGHRKS